MSEPSINQGHGSDTQKPENGDFVFLKGNVDENPRLDRAHLSKLVTLAQAMVLNSGDQANDGPDAEENLYVPAGYTYLGQFIDHDLTLDITSELAPQSKTKPTNLRTPRFDLDCLYGDGPKANPFMYSNRQTAEENGVALLYGGKGPGSDLNTPWDLLRSANGRAIIGDPRNDENSIVCQIQLAFVKFHNQVATELARTKRLKGKELFEAARNEVRWAYQKILMEDFLPRIVQASVLKEFTEAFYSSKPDSAFKWYLNTPELRKNLPREFVAAAYRFGHSMVRTGYRLNGVEAADGQGFRANIFTSSNDPANSLVGFDPLPATHVISDWGRFFSADHVPGTGPQENIGTTTLFDDGGDPSPRLQYAYKIDTTLSDPLAKLPSKIATPDDLPSELNHDRQPPSLALLNLLRGDVYQLLAGEDFAKNLAEADQLPSQYLCVRRQAKGGGFDFMHISKLIDTASGQPLGGFFDGKTPLWFYILAEAQRPLVELWEKKRRPLTEDDLKGQGSATFAGSGVADQPNQGAGTQLGPVGGRLVTEVFYGVLQSDETSVLNVKPKDWQPLWGGSGPATMDKLLKYARLM